MNSIKNRILEAVVTNVVITGLATALVHFGYKNIPLKFSSVLGSALPSSLGGLGLTCAALVGVVRIWDRVLGINPQFNKPRTCKNLAKKQFLSFCFTVLTGAVAGALSAAAAGSALIPAIISVAVTAAIVWGVVKIVDALIFAYKRRQEEIKAIEEYVYLEGTDDTDF